MRKPVQVRLEEFSNYHRDGDGECNAMLLHKYAKGHGMSEDDKFDLAYFFSVVYCCESGIILFNNRSIIKDNPVKAARELKKDMIFQSDRKYMKMRNCFEKSLCFWKNLKKDSISRFVSNGVLNLQAAIECVETWYMFGRFSAFLFLETYATLMEYDVTETTIDWPNGDTATSGLLNLFGHDSEADKFDKDEVLQVPTGKMDEYLEVVKENVSAIGGDTNTTKIETSLCAYRKFYKGTRYNGYYLDRMLEELVEYSKKPRYKNLTRELFEIREQCFPDEFLGEKHGWLGIRKEQKKLYKEYGII